MSSKNKRITTRAGYYLGYLLTKDLGKTKSLPELAQMNPKQILPMLEKKIDELAKAK